MYFYRGGGLYVYIASHSMGIRRLWKEPEEVLDPDEEPDPELEDPPVEVEDELGGEEEVGGEEVGGEEVGGEEVGGVDVGGLGGGGARRRGAVTLVKFVELVALQPEAMVRRLKRATSKKRIL
jgi:hypothetical protein